MSADEKSGYVDDPPRVNRTLLELVDVSVRFSTQAKGWLGKNRFLEAVSHVSLSVPAGRSLGLVGESGCGKSTLARTAVVLNRPYQGRILFGGTDLLKMNPRNLRRMRRRFQMIFQDPRSSLNPRMKVSKLIAEPLVIHHPDVTAAQRRQKVSELIELVRLDSSTGTRFPHELSGGQR
ncbi:MAG: ATP-binding cassette domain-containing protein, partial [Planctomycetota bacterium]